MRGRAGKRDAIEKEIVQSLRDCGRQVVLLESTEDGMPDLLVLGPGGFTLLEVKDPKKGVMSPEQLDWHASYRGPRGSLHVVRSREQALKACGI